MEFANRNGENITITLGALKPLTVTPEMFVFQKKNYPKVVFNDLR
jgi:hypothetical protein